MNHSDAIKLGACEKYLMGELAAPLRDEFEEHYFSCAECARDVNAASLFVAGARREFQHASVPALVRAGTTVSTKRPWLAWLRPVFAAPVLAALVLIVLYQNTVTIPHWRGQATSSSVVSTVLLHNGMARGPENPIALAPGQSLALYLEIPTQPLYPSYRVRLESKSSAARDLTTLSAQDIQKPPLLRMPSDLQPGADYKIRVTGIPESGSAVEVGNFSFLIENPASIEQH